MCSQQARRAECHGGDLKILLCFPVLGGLVASCSMENLVLTLVLLNCSNFRHLELELLTQFPATNDENSITTHMIYEK